MDNRDIEQAAIGPASEKLIPVSKLYHDMEKRYKCKYLWLYMAFFSTYLGLTFHRIDATWAHETKLVYDTALDRLGGIPAAENSWCDQDTRKTEGTTNASCWWDYYDLENLEDMTFFLTNRLSTMGAGIRGICSECLMAIAVSGDDILGLDLDKFACSDFTSERGNDDYHHRDCDVVDAAWTAQPVSYSPPCCRNQTLVEASVLLKAWAYWQDADAYLENASGAEVKWLLSDGVVKRANRDVWDCKFERQVSSPNATDLDQLFYCYLAEKLSEAGNFMQVIVSREDRFLGMNLDGSMRGHGWDRRWVKPTVRLWSLRVDTLKLQTLLTALWLSIDSLIVLMGVQATVLGFRSWKWDFYKHMHLRRAMTFVPALTLPILVEVFRIYMTTPLWTIFITVTEILLLIGFVVQLEIVNSIRVIVRIITKASKGVVTLTVVLVPLWFVMGLLYCQLFGVQRYDGIAQALHDLFSIFVVGKEVEAEDFTYGPTPYWMMYYISSVMLVLTLSQVFITILIDAYSESRTEEARLMHAWRIPEGYRLVGEPTSFKEQCMEIICDFFCGYSLRFHCWTRSLMHGLRLAIAKQDDESLVMLSETEVRAAMVEVRCGPGVVDLLAAEWAHVAEDTATMSTSTRAASLMHSQRPDITDGLFVDDVVAKQLAQLRANIFALGTELGCSIPYKDLEMLGLAALQRLHSHLSGLVPTTPSASPEELVELRTMAYSLAKQQGCDISYPELQQMRKASLEAVLRGLQTAIQESPAVSNKAWISGSL
mmetsp:Transcript_5964/g.13049  ORF Transcript_5964/g.13049 Transcript_5964/m.13049 type:complete len:768 (-) Transcript_5964:43-2346(-)